MQYGSFRTTRVGYMAVVMILGTGPHGWLIVIRVQGQRQGEVLMCTFRGGGWAVDDTSARTKSHSPDKIRLLESDSDAVIPISC